MTLYWNHNSAYHNGIVGVAAERHGRVLDVGCGEGLLIQRLSLTSESVTGIDPDGAAVARARIRTSALPNVTVEQVGFMEYDAKDESCDLVTFVASLHHLNTAAALKKARSLLRPGGELIVVGLSANKTVVDGLVSGLQIPLVRLAGWMHHEVRDIGVVATPPQESLREIRRVVRRELGGARIRRGLYYRYVLHWRKI